MSLFVTGDIHGDIDIKKLSNKNFNSSKLTKDDYMIICGDFGMPWVYENGQLAKNEVYWLKWLNERKFTTLYVDGNHENHDILRSWGTAPWQNGIIHPITDSIYHLMRGNIFYINGLKIWAFGGATSHDKAHRREGVSWFSGEVATTEEMDYGVRMLEAVNYEVDIIITHTPPRTITQLMKFDTDCPVASYLDFIMKNVRYKHWYCGHMHSDIDIWDYNIHLLYNNITKII